MPVAEPKIQPRLKLRYEQEIAPSLRERNFMKIVSLAPEVL